ncbi:hypothetical protein HDU96_003210 [Phlyctochytrium bullatum]|nr:hypothetical protein HDU96_003210 [Phlyctochytrium bullatum]
MALDRYLFELKVDEFCDRQTFVHESKRYRRLSSNQNDGEVPDVDRQHSPEPQINGFSKSQSPVTHIYIFDFDSTLFRSPLPNPDLWAPEVLGTLISDCGWFVEPRSLRSPYIPSSPDKSWWDLDVIAEVRKAMQQARSSGTAVVALLTGRRHDLFADRIRELCNVFDDKDPLEFDLYFFREGFDPLSPLFLPTTLDFKFAVLDKLLKAFPQIEVVSLWDDRKRHLDLFEKDLLSRVNAGRIKTYQLTHIVHDPALEKYIPADLERVLVNDMVAKCNARIMAAKEREEKRKADLQQQSLTDSTDAKPSSRARKPSTSNLSRPFSVPVLAAVSESSNLCSEPEMADIPSVCSLAESDKQQEKSSSVPDLVSKKTPSKTSKQTPPEQQSNLKAMRRASASLFRSIIELADVVYYTGIFLDDASRDLLLAQFPPPPRWSIRAHHVTICMGQAGQEMVNFLGGMGAKVKLKVTARGTIPGKVVAVKVELAETPIPKLSAEEERDHEDEEEAATRASTSLKSPRLSTNAVPHITLAVAVGAHARESNDIKDWEPLFEPLILSGTIGEKKLVGLKGRGQSGVNAKPKEVSLGGLVMKHHPGLKGQEIGKAVRAVEKWMAKTFMDNLAQNSAAIELFITNLKVVDGRVEDEA